jgi:hypothetical protein
MHSCRRGRVEELGHSLATATKALYELARSAAAFEDQTYVV